MNELIKVEFFVIEVEEFVNFVERCVEEFLEFGVGDEKVIVYVF